MARSISSSSSSSSSSLLLALAVAVAALFCANEAVTVMADRQHDVLMDLFTTTGGSAGGWKDSTNWGVAKDYCTWKGIKCVMNIPGTPVIINVVLKNNNLQVQYSTVQHSAA